MTEHGIGEHPTACSMQVSLDFGSRMRESDIRARIDKLLAGLRSFLRENGCKLIGHIKGLLDAGDRGRLYFSVASFDDDPRYKGEIDGEIYKADLSINVIVYGVGEESVEGAVREQLGKQFANIE